MGKFFTLDSATGIYADEFPEPKEGITEVDKRVWEEFVRSINFGDFTKACFSDPIHDSFAVTLKAPASRLIRKLLKGELMGADRAFLAETLPKDKLSIVYITDHNTACRSCLSRNSQDTPVVVVASNTQGLKIETSLCFPCYDRVRQTLENPETFPTTLKLPRLNSLKMQDRYAEGMIFCDVPGRPRETMLDAVRILRHAVGLVSPGQPKYERDGSEKISL